MSIKSQLKLPENVTRRALVISPFFSPDSLADRPRTVAEALSRSMPVDLLTSDFDHLRKAPRSTTVAPFEHTAFLHTISYQSNVSPKRLISHILFAPRALLYFLQNRRAYTVVYVTLPLNVTAWLILSFSGNKTKIVDVVDIWPDVLPFTPAQKFALSPIFFLWKWFFKASIQKADRVMAVSDSFLAEAKRYANPDAQAQRFYIAQDRLDFSAAKQPLFTLAFVGNLGYLYDFETLLEVLAENENRQTVQLFLIGDGDRKDWLLSELSRRKILHRFWGVVYDPAQLGGILTSCHAGFNGYVRTSASFSYKACTYLAAGLPLLNSMTGDLRTLVLQHGLGENYNSGNRDQLRAALRRLCNGESESMRRNCEEFFSSSVQRSQVLVQIETFLASDSSCPVSRLGQTSERCS